MKLVSLILTTYNCAENLKKTLTAIDSQDYLDIEVVIKDGLSTDDTVDVIKDYAEESRYTVIWKSCEDTGIYDAMNQGYELSHGEYILFINDFLLQKDAISKLVNAIESDERNVGAHANLIYSNENKVVRYWKMGPQRSFYSGWMPGHPTFMLKREIYEKIGLYDTSYRISADYDLMQRALKKGSRIGYVPEVIVSMYYGGTSTSSSSGYIDGLKEAHRALNSNGYRFAYVIDALRTIRVLMQFVNAKFYKAKRD